MIIDAMLSFMIIFTQLIVVLFIMHIYYAAQNICIIMYVSPQTYACLN